MAELLPAAAPTQTPCKCCGAAATLYGVVDFNKNCEAFHGRFPLAMCGVPVYYHRCPRCGFIFTIAFDHFTPDDFLRHIYNEQYRRVDPEFEEIRPRDIASFVANAFPAARPLRVLDYGGGTGRTAALLREAGFADVTVYDPFVAAHATRPQGRFGFILCREVVEHSPDPRGIFGDLAALLDEDEGLIHFSTLLQPQAIGQLGVQWWYAAPRNGHVSLFTQPAIDAVVRPLGLTMGSFSDDLHVLFRPGRPPAFARHHFASSPG